jgi:catechol 2,3-dioxygenase-like lactoylglutathione lyase family enzyme
MALTINKLKIYVPARDFEVSKRFYRDLGFELTEAWNGNHDCRLGDAEFRLQNYYVKDWAGNFMMQFEVDDVDAWHAHAVRVVSKGGYDTRIMGPEDHENVRLCHVVDPSGVLLTFIGPVPPAPEAR